MPVAALKAVEAEGFTVTVSEKWREPLTEMAKYLGVPEGEYADFLMCLGNWAFSRKFQHGLTNNIAWWLIEMHSKYPKTFNAGSWEGSCSFLSIENLYKERRVPVGKFQEWERQRAKRTTWG